VQAKQKGRTWSDEAMVKRAAFDAEEARRAAAANPFAAFNVARVPIEDDESTELTDADEQPSELPQPPTSAPTQEPETMIKKKVSDYTPRPGSKGAMAMMALLDGPMSTAQLARAIDTPAANLKNNLQTCTDRKLIVTIKDDTGLLHYALPGNTEITERSAAPKKASKKAKPAPVKKPPLQVPPDADAAAAPALADRPNGSQYYVHGVTTFDREFRCGLFSNGDFVIEKGPTTIQLDVEQTRQMVRYLERMAGPEGVPA